MIEKNHLIKKLTS